MASVGGVEERNNGDPVNGIEDVGGEPQPVAGESKTVIVVAGRPHNGKSQALNNIFRVDFKCKCSAFSVTRKISHLRVLKEGKELIIIDTPGLGAADIPLERVKKEFEHIVGGLNYTLLFCHSVGPNNMLTDTDRVVLKNLQRVCGSSVWKKCVILFTFSDTLREQGFPKVEDREEYLGTLRDHASQLAKMLRQECGKVTPDVKIALDVAPQAEAIDEIVAVPVGLKYKDKKEKHLLLPDEVNEKDWRKRAYLEILRKSKPLDRVTLLTVTHGAATVSSAYLGVGIGILIGGFTGTCVGILAGGFGAIPGAVIGAVAGGITGGMGGAGAGHMVVSNITNVKAGKVKRLSTGKISVIHPEQEEQVQPQHIPHSPPRATPTGATLETESDSERQQWAARTYPVGPRLLRTPDPVAATPVKEIDNSNRDEVDT